MAAAAGQGLLYRESIDWNINGVPAQCPPSLIPTASTALFRIIPR
jgi:hypothetical protein